MYKFLSHLLLSSSAILLSQLTLLTLAMAEEIHQKTEATQAQIQAVEVTVFPQLSIVGTTSNIKLQQFKQDNLLTQIDDSTRAILLEPTQFSENRENTVGTDAMAQVPSSHLSDVQPTDWVFQAWRSLIERYVCVAGYPDQTDGGNRAITRKKFAVGLAACLARLTDRVAVWGLSLQDVETIQRLQEEFASELTTLASRADTVEASITELEANQFSTTTKLEGYASFDLTGATVGDAVKREFGARNTLNQPLVGRDNNSNVTAVSLVELYFTTSFTGEDLLVMGTEFAMGSGFPPADIFISEGPLSTGGDPLTNLATDPNPNAAVTDPEPNVASVSFLELFYSFLINDAIRVSFGPIVDWYSFFDINRFTTSYLVTANSIDTPLVNVLFPAAGVFVEWNLSEQLKLNFGYLDEAHPIKGLFGGANSFTVELTYASSPNANFRLLYQHANINTTARPRLLGGEFKGIATQPVLGVADDGLGGDLEDARADIFGVNFDWLINSRLGLFGRYTYASTHLEPVTPSIPSGNLTAQSFQVGVAFPDLGKKGAQAAISYVVPFDILNGGIFLASGGGDGGTQFEIEATYYYPITDKIAILPTFYAIGNPNNFSDNPTIYVVNLRTEFSF